IFAAARLCWLVQTVYVCEHRFRSPFVIGTTANARVGNNVVAAPTSRFQSYAMHSSRPQDLIASLLPEEAFFPTEPRNLDDVGVPETVVDSLALKTLSFAGSQSGRGLAESLCLPFGIVEPRLMSCRTRQLMTHVGSAPLNDYVYSL